MARSRRFNALETANAYAAEQSKQRCGDYIMELTFRLSRKEYEECIKTVTGRIFRKGNMQKTSLFYGIFFWSMMIFIFLDSWTYFRNNSSGDFGSPYMVVFALIIAIIIMICKKVHQQRAIMYFSVDEFGPVLGDQKVSFADSSIHFVARDQDSHIFWSAINHFEETKNLFLLYTDISKALFIPKRVFPTQEQKASFVDLVKSKQPS